MGPPAANLFLAASCQNRGDIAIVQRGQRGRAHQGPHALTARLKTTAVERRGGSQPGAGPGF